MSVIALPAHYPSLTPAERRAVRAQYEQQQGYRCHHCRGSLLQEPIGPDAGRRVNRSLFPDGFFTHPVHLHHDHKTGMTIGTVHAHCNAVLWQFYGE